MCAVHLFCYRGAVAADRGDLTLEEVVATADGGPAAKIGLLLADHEKTLQDLVSQIVTHWKARAAPGFCAAVLKMLSAAAASPSPCTARCRLCTCRLSRPAARLHRRPSAVCQAPNPNL